MATVKTETTQPTDSIWATYQGMTENAKEVVGWQLKTGLAMFDQAIKVGQTITDFYQQRAGEGIKLTQTLCKTGLESADEYRRGLVTLADKATRA